MKIFIISLVLHIGKIGMQILYFFIKLFTKQNKNKVLLLSRQSNTINLDFRLIKEELEKYQNKENDKLQVKVLCKKIPKD